LELQLSFNSEYATSITAQIYQIMHICLPDMSHLFYLVVVMRSVTDEI